MHAKADRHQAADPKQHAAKVGAIAARLHELPKAEAAEERERVLDANRTTEAGRIENARAGWKDGGAISPSKPSPWRQQRPPRTLTLNPYPSLNP